MTDEETQDQPKHPGGRPLKFETVEDLDQAIRAYFDSCDPHIEERLVDNGVNQRGQTIWVKREVMTEQKPYTVSGLANALGVTRQTLLNYKDRPEFFDSIQYAMNCCEQYAESMLYSPYSNGAKFNLTNNYDGWEDKKVQDHQTKGKPIKALVEFVGDDNEQDDEPADSQG